MAHVHIIGAGLIGTSIGLKLREEKFSISISDPDEKNQKMAQDLLQSVPKPTKPDVLLIATPPDVVFQILKDEFERNASAIFIDIAGIKSKLHVQVEGFPEIAERFCSAHPMAGREVSGPTSARADLFQSRPWIITPTTRTNKDVLEFVEDLGALLGGSIFFLGAPEHDAAIAAVSHLPQIISTLMASLLAGAQPQTLELAGQGLRDVTRLADSDSQLWSHLLLANAEVLTPFLEKAMAELYSLISALSSQNSQAVEVFLAKGKAGRSLIPGKHGGTTRNYTYVPIVISDNPGELALIFQECSEIGVNIEDLSIEHSPKQETGLITLAMSDSDAHKLQRHLSDRGWLAHFPRK